MELYYYDNETQLYYLQSRYYNPEIGRFINADAFVSTGQGLVGNNMFAYCGNNPVSYYDPTGNLRSYNVMLTDSGMNSQVRAYLAIKQSNEQSFANAILGNKIADDIKNYDPNNQSEEVVFSSNYFSCYKGTFVLKTNLDTSFSFGFIGLSTLQQNSNMLNHEYGHRVQLDNLGWKKYITNVAIPSVTANLLDRIGKLPYDYYGSPWEAEADFLGGVVRTRNNTPWPEGAYNNYGDLIRMVFD